MDTYIIFLANNKQKLLPLTKRENDEIDDVNDEDTTCLLKRMIMFD